jgi:hypothetical protein
MFSADYPYDNHVAGPRVLEEILAGRCQGAYRTVKPGDYFDCDAQLLGSNGTTAFALNARQRFGRPALIHPLFPLRAWLKIPHHCRPFCIQKIQRGCAMNKPKIATPAPRWRCVDRHDVGVSARAAGACRPQLAASAERHSLSSARRAEGRISAITPRGRQSHCQHRAAPRRGRGDPGAPIQHQAADGKLASQCATAS